MQSEPFTAHSAAMAKQLEDERAWQRAEEEQQRNTGVLAGAPNGAQATTPERQLQPRASGETSKRFKQDFNPERSIYTILDTVTLQFVGGLQMHRNDQSAIRTLVDIIRTNGNMIAAHPRDFELWRLGTVSEAPYIVPNETLVLAGHQINELVNVSKEQEQQKQQ